MVEKHLWVVLPDYSGIMRPRLRFWEVVIQFYDVLGDDGILMLADLNDKTKCEEGVHI